ncbi:MAG: hypothetical protein ACK5MP_00870 [Nostocoides sp.]
MPKDAYPGLDTVEVEGYRLLVLQGPATVEEFGRWFPTALADPGAVLKSMHRKGLASPDDAGRYWASPPYDALAPRISRTEESLSRARLELESLAEQYRMHCADSGIGTVFDVIQGAAAVAQRSRAMMTGARKGILAMASDIDFREALSTGGYPELVEFGRIGLEHLLLIDRSTLARPNFYAEIAPYATGTTQVRIAASVPTRIMLVDETIAMLPMLSNEDSHKRALIIHKGPLLDALVSYFRSAWMQSSELVTGADGPREVSDTLEPGDAKMLSLLMTGITDQAIAHQLDLSLRTVQRRVHALMDKCGASTRLQLGFEAGRRGWLPQHRITPDDSQPPPA